MKANRTYLILILMMTGLFLSMAVAMCQQTAGQLYEKALYLEEAKGSLQDAIDLYNQIAENKNADQSIQVKALLHMGLCYEKLGKQEAVKSYQRLVNNFPTYKNEVAIARERLSRLMQSGNKVLATPLMPKFTKIKIPTKLWLFVALSPNGKDLALVSDDKLWKMPVTGNLGPEYPGITEQLNTEDIKVEASCISWSHDGKWIAFNNLPQSNDASIKISNQSIYRIPSDGGSPHEILNNYRDSPYVNYRISLSPDGQNLAYSSVENNEQHIYTTQVTGGSPKQLVDIQAREPVYSPNGKWIAYVEDKNLGKDGGDLWVIPAVGGVPKLVAKAGRASNPVWSPDGKMIAFLDLNKNKQINLVKLQQDGETTGKVYSIDAPVGVENLACLAGWTPENKIGILATTNREFALFSLPSKGGQAAMVLKDYSWVYQPRWSHDGRQIYYITAPGMGIEQGLKLRLASVSAVGGSGELFTLLTTNDGDTIRTITYQGGNQISPDGKMLISSAWTSKDLNPLNPYFPNLKIWKFSLDGSERVQITNKSGNYADFCPCWSPDGEKVAFIRSRMEKRSFLLQDYKEAGIFIIDSVGNESQILPYSDDKFFFSLSWSPDGKMLAYFTREKEATNKGYMNVLYLETGKTMVISEFPTVHEYMELAWSPDSRRIVFNGDEIQVVNIDDGSIETIESNLLDVIKFQIDWSPDGKKIVFAGLIVPKSEFWFLEDFLPLENLEQKPETEIAEASKGITIKPVWTGPEVGDFHSISADGKYLSYVARETGDLGIRNLETGENRLLTNEGCWNGPYYWSDDNLLTADGKKIIYSWYNDDDEYDLRSLEINKSQPRIIYKPETSEELLPKLFYSDDKKVFVQRFMSSEPWYLASVNLENGDIVNLKDFEGNYSMKLAMSPDPKYFGFDFWNKNDELRYDIHLLSIDGKEELPLVDHPANDRLIGWLPGKDVMLFISDRSGTSDLWATNTAKFFEPGEPQLILKNVGDINPLGFDNNGNLFYSVEFRKYNSYIVPMDQSNGKLQFQSRQPLFGSMRDPVWFDDGVRLLYTEYSIIPRGLQDHTLILNNTETGNSRRLADNISCFGSARLSPDEKSVLVLGYDKTRINNENYKGGIYIIDTGSGKATEISVVHDASRSYPVEWDNNGENIFYISNNQIIKHNIKSGMENAIFEDKDLSVMTILKRSPDGNHLFFDLQKGDKEKHLMSISPDGGGLRTISKLNIPFGHVWYKMIGFSPNENHIYFSTGSYLWKIPYTGGNHEEVWHSDNPIAGFSIHPDGTKMVLSLYEREVEIRTIENLAQELERLDKMEK